MTHAFLAFLLRQRRSRSPIKRGADFRTSLAFYGFSSSVIPDFVIPSEGASPTRNLPRHVIPSECEESHKNRVRNHAPGLLLPLSIMSFRTEVVGRVRGISYKTSFRIEILPPFGRQNDSNVISNARERSPANTLLAGDSSGIYPSE